ARTRCGSPGPPSGRCPARRRARSGPRGTAPPPAGARRTRRRRPSPAPARPSEALPSRAVPPLACARWSPAGRPAANFFRSLSDVTCAAYIIQAVRPPIGRYGGSLAKVRTDDLLAIAIRALLDRQHGLTVLVEDVLVGCANQAGEDNRNVARMSLLLAG